jgi:hypothetical protein
MKTALKQTRVEYNRQTDGQTDRQTDRETYRQTDKQTGRQTENKGLTSIKAAQSPCTDTGTAKAESCGDTRGGSKKGTLNVRS